MSYLAIGIPLALVFAALAREELRAQIAPLPPPARALLLGITFSFWVLVWPLVAVALCLLALSCLTLTHRR